MTRSWRSFLVAAAGLLAGSLLATAPMSGASPEPSAVPTDLPSPSPAPAAAPDLGAFSWFEVSETKRGSELRVGRFDGWSRLVARGGHTIRADGPQDGLVAAVVPTPHGSSILLIDARTGETRRFLRTRDRLGDIVLDRANDHLWWVTQVDDEHAQLWRAALDSGDPERVGDPTPSIITLLDRSPDGRQLIRSGLSPEGTFVGVIDVSTGVETAVDGTVSPVGMFDGRLIDLSDCSELCGPIRAIHPTTGAVEILIDDRDPFARITATPSGTTELIGIDDGRYIVLGADGTRVSLDAVDGGARLPVRDTGYADAETPGYLPLVTDGRFVDEGTGAPTVIDAILLPLDGSAAFMPGAAASHPMRSPATSPGEDQGESWVR